MTRKPIVRVAAAITGGLFATFALLALLLAVNAGAGFEGTTGTTPLGWTVPLIAGALVGAVAWLLLAEDVQDPDMDHRAATCSACGEGILEDWRMCPYCGDMVSNSPESTRVESL